MRELTEFKNYAKKVTKNPSPANALRYERSSRLAMHALFSGSIYRHIIYTRNDVRQFIKSSGIAYEAIRNIPDKGDYGPGKYADNILDKKKQAEILLSKGINELNSYIRRKASGAKESQN